MLKYVHDVKTLRKMGWGIADHSVVLFKVRLVGTWIKRWEKVNGTGRIESENLRE